MPFSILLSRQTTALRYRYRQDAAPEAIDYASITLRRKLASAGQAACITGVASQHFSACRRRAAPIILLPGRKFFPF